jgi:FAD/FMN-containing dehydrogenase
MGAWQEWAPVAPDAMAASLLLNVDAGALRVRVFGAMADTEAETTQQLGELAEAAGATPTSATVRPGSYREAKRFLSGLGEADEEDEGHPHSKSEFIAQRLPEDAIDALLAHLRVAPAPAELDFSPWGGAYTRVAREATAFAHRDARFLLKHAVVVDPGAPDGAARDWLARSWEIAHPSGTGGVYANFPDSDLDDWDAAYHGANRERLLAVKRRYDPENVFG